LLNPNRLSTGSLLLLEVFPVGLLMRNEKNKNKNKTKQNKTKQRKENKKQKAVAAISLQHPTEA